MARIRVEKREHHVHRLASVLTVGLSFLVGATILLSHNNPSITGGAVFESIYGGYSSLLVALILGLLIYVYVRIRG